MTAACQLLHETLALLPRFAAGFDPRDIPRNGLYFLFEKGETAHGGERIVRVGTHTGQNNLPKRLNEHLFALNKDRSIFRKHIGRCLLSRAADPFLAQWEIDLTTRQAREKFEASVDKKRLAEVERDVSRYIAENFSFAVLAVDDKQGRLAAETQFLSTIAQCPVCKASARWLGRHHPKRIICDTGLWNMQGLAGSCLDQAAVTALFRAQDPSQ